MTVVQSRLLLLPLLLALVACASTPEPTAAPAFVVPTPTLLPPEDCRWTLQQEGPREAAGLEDALERAGLPGADALTTGFSEHCYGVETGAIRGRGWELSDFDITLPVSDLDDHRTLGAALDKMIEVLASFPPGQNPPQLGLIRITFVAGPEQRSVHFTADQFQRLGGRGQRGMRLLDSLPPTPTTPTPSVVVKSTQYLELLVGTLVRSDGCLRVNSALAHVSFLLVWPPEYEVTLEGDTIRIEDWQGNVVILQVGQLTRMGGAETSEEYMQQQLRPGMPADCGGPYWVVGPIESSAVTAATFTAEATRSQAQSPHHMRAWWELLTSPATSAPET